MPVFTKLSRAVFWLGIILLPLVHFPSELNGFEGPKVFWFQRWVEVLVVLAILGRVKVGRVWLLVAFFFWALLASLLGVDSATSVFGLPWRGQGFWMLAHYLALAMITPGIFSGKAMALAAGLVAIWEVGLIWEKNWLGLPIPLYLSRPVGSFGQPDFLAGFLALGLPFAWLWRGLRWGLIGLLVLGILLTGSKGAIVALLISGVILGLLRWRKTWGVWVLAGGLVVGAAFWFSKIPTTPELTTSRQRIYGRAILAAAKRPVLGYGLENYELAVANIDYPVKIAPGFEAVVDKAHNEVLEVLVGSGVVGLLIWAVIVWKTLATFIKKRQYIFLAALLIFLVKAQTNVVSTMEYAVFWMLVGLGVSFKDSMRSVEH